MWLRVRVGESASILGFKWWFRLLNDGMSQRWRRWQAALCCLDSRRVRGRAGCHSAPAVNQKEKGLLSSPGDGPTLSSHHPLAAIKHPPHSDCGIRGRRSRINDGPVPLSTAVLCTIWFAQTQNETLWQLLWEPDFVGKIKNLVRNQFFFCGLKNFSKLWEAEWVRLHFHWQLIATVVACVARPRYTYFLFLRLQWSSSKMETKTPMDIFSPLFTTSTNIFFCRLHAKLVHKLLGDDGWKCWLETQSPKLAVFPLHLALHKN